MICFLKQFLIPTAYLVHSNKITELIYDNLVEFLKNEKKERTTFIR